MQQWQLKREFEIDRLEDARAWTSTLSKHMIKEVRNNEVQLLRSAAAMLLF